MTENPFKNIKIPEIGNTSTSERIPDNVDALELKVQKRERYVQDTRHRRVLATWVMWVVSLWLGLVLLLISSNTIFNLGMQSEVQIALLATTTVNVLGLAFIVLKGLFN